MMIAEPKPKPEHYHLCGFSRSPDSFKKLEAQIVRVVKRTLHDIHEHDFKILGHAFVILIWDSSRNR